MNNCCPIAQPGGCHAPTLEEIPVLLLQYTQEQIAGDQVLKYLKDLLATVMKLNAHLEHIVMPLGVPMNAKEIQALCDRATYAQRMAAIDRARIRVPFLLPDEERTAQRWADLGERL